MDDEEFLVVWGSSGGDHEKGDDGAVGQDGPFGIAGVEGSAGFDGFASAPLCELQGFE